MVDQMSMRWMWLKITTELQALVQKMMNVVVKDIIFYKEDFYSMKGSILLSFTCSVPSAKMSTEEVVLYYVLYCTGFIMSFLL